jgi:hypothetical protein
MLAEEKGSVVVIDDVGSNLRTKLATGLQARGVKITYPESSLRFAQSMMQFLVFFLGGGSRAATIAYAFWMSAGASWLHINAGELTSSKTSFSLYWVKALHSTYLTAPSSFAIRSPSSFLTGVIFCFASFSRTLGSSLRSVCVPTMRQGTPGQ